MDTGPREVLVRFRRRRAASTPDANPAETAVPASAANSAVPKEQSSQAQPGDPRLGPLEYSDRHPDLPYVDLGSILIPPMEGFELRLQVDETTGTILGIFLMTPEGVLELRAFASSRGGDLWEETRVAITEQTSQRGGSVVEQAGPFGVELLCEVPVTGPQGDSMMQPSRVIGYTGERWFLRATIAGTPATNREQGKRFEEAIRHVVVRRGSEARPPGEPLPLQMPPETRLVAASDQSGAQ